ncbi:29266_t:CDS:1, partial [Gigaspora margarita]
IETVQIKVIKTALRKSKKYDNLAKNYYIYLKQLRAKKDPNAYIKAVAVKMFLDEEAFNQRIENYRKRYIDNELFTSLNELYIVYYKIAKEENCERSAEEVEQIFNNMSI